ncbi:hypothetical protein GBZ26_25645 [Azospirillum formosense]|uniref:Quinol:cytochrome c oxidoreductase quinone-binding subunit 2 n=1 Tax=Azospirillum formosense TaxID=861533 RepID=A0ABX2L105_9PROT|nr:hypothetical protein [Azospirillum formosense]NUB22553.1 hypothetical protein [Azospirillum formosense]
MTILRFLLECWLAAAMVVLWLPVGALALLLMARLFPTGWSRPLVTELTAVTGTLPFAALAVLPVLLGAGLIYPWMREGTPEKAFWLAPWFFAGRTVVYLLVWWLLARLAMRPNMERAAAAAGLIVLGLTVTFAGIDWMMSLEPEFASSAYGLLVLTAAAQAGFAAALGLRLRDGPPPEPEQLGHMGSLLLTLVLSWGYIAFMQYLVVWSGNKPHLVSWYLARGGAPWGWFAWALVFLKGVLPFAALLFPPARRSPRVLGALCLLILAGHAVDMLWLVLPAFKEHAVWHLPPALLFGGALVLTGHGLLRRKNRLTEAPGHG